MTQMTFPRTRVTRTAGSLWDRNILMYSSCGSARLSGIGVTKNPWPARALFYKLTPNSIETSFRTESRMDSPPLIKTRGYKSSRVAHRCPRCRLPERGQTSRAHSSGWQPGCREQLQPPGPGGPEDVVRLPGARRTTHARCCGREARVEGISTSATPEVRSPQKIQHDSGRNS